MEITQLAKILKALSHPNRLELYFEIAKKQESSFEDCACLITDIMETLNIGAPTVSHHLKELANAGLIVTERQGKFLVAKIQEATLCDVVETLSAYCKN